MLVQARNFPLYTLMYKKQHGITSFSALHFLNVALGCDKNDKNPARITRITKPIILVKLITSWNCKWVAAFYAFCFPQITHKTFLEM